MASLSAKLHTLTDPDLGVTMIARPDVGFDTLDAAFAALGFRRETLHSGGQQLLKGEPNAALWSFGGGNPTAVYSFNPVARLRVLEVGTLPPGLRRDLRAKVPMMTADDLVADLGADEQRPRLRALWGLVALERADLRDRVTALARDATGPIAEEAARAAARLDQIAAAQVKMLTAMRVVAGTAMPVIAAIGTAREGAPRQAGPEDCAGLFTDDVAGAIARHVAARPVPEDPPAAALPETVEDVTACPAGMLRGDNALSRRFPLGYRSAAGWLKPERVWVAWRGTAPDGSHVAHDGLVFSGGAWLYLPRPFRLVARAVPSVADGAAAP